MGFPTRRKNSGIWVEVKKILENSKIVCRPALLKAQKLDRQKIY